MLEMNLKSEYDMEIAVKAIVDLCRSEPDPEWVKDVELFVPTRAAEVAFRTMLIEALKGQNVKTNIGGLDLRIICHDEQQAELYDLLEDGLEDDEEEEEL